MKKYKLLYYGHPFLRKKCQPITIFDQELKQLAKDMIEMMQEVDGIGLSSNQIGIDKRIFITQAPVETEDGKYTEGEVRVFINPRLFEPSEDADVREEGCLSIPNLYVPVERPLGVKVEYQDLEGNTHIEEFYGYITRTIMHENDHINGVLMVDRTDPTVRRQMEQRLRELKKKYKNS